MNFYQRRKILKKTNALDLVPVRIRGHEEEEGKVVVLVPKFQNKAYHIFSERLKKLFFRIKLDSLGSATWKLIDGKRSVRDLSHEMQKHEDMKEVELKEIDERLSIYMTELYERRFISFKQILDEE